MAPIAISPPSPTLDSTTKLTKVGTQNTLSKTVSNPSPKIADLDASKLTITHTPNPKVVPHKSDPVIWTQSCTTDHMLQAKWTEAHGWEAPSIVPYGPLSIMPIASVLHYATECFEGMKAYRGYDGKVRLFRPERNADRFLSSATRIALPGFPPEEFLKMLETFVGLEAPKWLPDGEDGERGHFIYLRPTMIATAAALGVQKPKEALMYVVAVLFPPLDQGTGPLPDPKAQPQAPQTNGTVVSKKQSAPTPQGMRLLASSHDMIRAWPGGFGYAKVGANYGPSLIAQGEARARGYAQILWLFGEEGFVTEAGGSNFFVLWKTKEDPSKLELVTAPLGDGIILPGVTRASILDLVRSTMPEIKVTERRFTMDEILTSAREDRLVEAFGSGTAFFVAPVSEIHYRGNDVILPMGASAESGKFRAPEFATKVKQALMDIQYGNVQHEWGVVVEELTE